jgi:uncharacterized membrane protein YgcG
MRHLVRLSMALALASGTLGTARQLGAQEPAAIKVAAEAWTPEELENLLAPIALYPDPILAQVLVAATYPEEIAAAAAYVRRNGTDGLDDQPWNISVRAVAYYAPVLNLMAEGEEWTIALGQAYVEQPKDVMAAVQQLRQMAQAQGNLVSTEQQKVVEEREVIRIEPAQPRVIYVPTYDPAVVYFRPVYVARAHPAYWSWGIGYPIGAWLTYDFDWWGPGVYYHGWYASGPRWVVVSRPWVVISPIYVSTRHTTVIVNRRIVHRSFDPRPLRRYTVVHRNTTFDRRGRPERGVGRNDRVDDRNDDRNGNRSDRSSGNPGRGDERREWNRGQGNERRVAPVPVGGRGVASSDRVRPISTGSDKAREPRGNGTWNGRESGSAAPARTNSRNVTPTRAAAPRADRGTLSPNASPRGNAGGALSGAVTGNGRGTSRASERGSSGSIPDAVRRTREARPSAGTLSRPRAESSAPRAERSAPRAERSAPRAERSAPRAERSAPRAERSAPRSERSAPRASSGGSGRSSSPSRGAGSSRSGGSGRSGGSEGRGGRGN